MDTLLSQLSDLQSRFQALSQKLNPEDIATQIQVLQTQSQNPDFWSDSSAAQIIMRKLASLQKQSELLSTLRKNLTDTKELLELEENPDNLPQFEAEIGDLSQQIESLETQTFLQGPYDDHSAILSIHAGQGGTEALDWTAMLVRMYLRFAEKRGWQIEVLDETPGEEAGYKNFTMVISGEYPYGYLKTEAGTHRLVRLSPFNADNLRQTTFALVEVLPQIEEDSSEIIIKPEEIEFEAFRSGGHGGQNVNKVSTAVRIKHLPSGIVVTSQTQRSQDQNRKNAMALLKSRLWERRESQKAKEKATLKGAYQPASWGTQIRSYVLHPYKMVKDMRTQVESSQPDKVLDGELDIFVESQLRTL